MFSICFQSDQDLFTYAKTKIEKNTHSSQARPKTNASGKLVGIADYMCTSLEANDSHHMIQIFQMYRWDI